MSKINLHNYEAFLIDYLDGNLNEATVAELKSFVVANPQLQIDLEDMDLPSIADELVNFDLKEDLKRSTVFVEDEELINYLENNLPEADKKAFELKLLSDKQLASKLEAYKNTILKTEDLAFAGKKALYRSEEELLLNNTALAYVEGQLIVSDKIKFEEELKTNPSLQKELASFQKTKLEADTSIVFSGKEALKKESKVIALFNFRTVASIAAAILLLIGLAFVFNYFNVKPNVAKELAKKSFNIDLKNTGNQKVNRVDSSNILNKILPENTSFIAKNNINVVKHNFIKKEPDTELKEPKTSSVAANNQNKQDPDKELNEPKNAITTNTAFSDTTNEAIAKTSQPKYSKQNYLLAEEPDADDQPVVTTPEKKGFWQRAVRLAKQVNKLGVKAIDGQQTQDKNYSLSFNSFSVEKR